MLGIPLFDRSLNVVEEYHKLLKSDIEVAPISDSGIFSISFYSSDPKVGIELLQNLAMITDNLIKDRAKKRSESNVKYLNSKLKTIANKEQRASLITTLAQEQKNIMATSTPLPYVAERFEKPFSSPGPMKPNVTLSLILYIFIGGVTGSLLAIVYELRFRKKKI